MPDPKVRKEKRATKVIKATRETRVTKVIPATLAYIMV